MPLTISTQKKHVWKKRIQKPELKGSIYFCQWAGSVFVTASAEHQAIYKRVLGSDSGTSSVETYLQWDSVAASELVELLYQIEIA